MAFSSPVATLVRTRYSCRTYERRPIAPDVQQALSTILDGCTRGPFGTPARLALVAATADDRAALKGLGTYGFIDNAPGFIVGAVERGSKALEDFGYIVERAILHATELGLGTCWLGGTFSKSRFARAIALRPHEQMPGVVATGYVLEGSRARDRIRRSAKADSRLPASSLFFEERFDGPLSAAVAGRYAGVLEAVRWAPSASNRQPWRLVVTEAGWHFFLRRSRRYGKGTLLFTVLRLADLQRVDIGIAMCHFELVARDLGLPGAWVIDDPGLTHLPDGVEYTATWRPER